MMARTVTQQRQGRTFRRSLGSTMVIESVCVNGVTALTLQFVWCASDTTNWHTAIQQTEEIVLHGVVV